MTAISTEPMSNGQPVVFAPAAASPRRARGVSVWHYAGVIAAGGVPLGAALALLEVPRATALVIGAGALFVAVTAVTVIAALGSLRRSVVEGRVGQEMTLLAEAVRRMNEHAVLSDDARRLLNRRQERELLIGAIEEDIQSEEWDAAVVLCNELAERFGYRAEAEDYRSRVDKARSVVQERRVADAIAQLDGLIVQRRWDAALIEAARIGRLFPDSPRVEGLRRRVEQARGVYKADLERRFLEAAGESRIEDAMELLKELDAYLTETEAAPYREVARGVISKARDNLGAQFKLAVQDRQWGSAAAIGRRIINEFPNSRMATEVRGMMDHILSQANAVQTG